MVHLLKKEQVSLTELYTYSCFLKQSFLLLFEDLFVGAMWTAMLGLTALPHVGGICGAVITKKEMKTWYASLNKPSWTPPDAAFGVVWTTLYTGMGLVHQSQLLTCLYNL